MVHSELLVPHAIKVQPELCQQRPALSTCNRQNILFNTCIFIRWKSAVDGSCSQQGTEWLVSSVCVSLNATSRCYDDDVYGGLSNHLVSPLAATAASLRKIMSIVETREVPPRGGEEQSQRRKSDGSGGIM